MSAPTKPHSPTFKPEPHSAANEPKHPAARPKHVALQQLTGAQAVIRSLEELGVDVIFGIPGGAVLPVYDPLFDSKKLHHVLVRHEQGAGMPPAATRTSPAGWACAWQRRVPERPTW